jgi:hypothetical protein
MVVCVGCLSVCRCVCRSGCLAVWLSGCLAVWLSGCLVAYLSGYLGVCLSVCLLIWLLVCLCPSEANDQVALSQLVGYVWSWFWLAGRQVLWFWFWFWFWFVQVVTLVAARLSGSLVQVRCRRHCKESNQRFHIVRRRWRFDVMLRSQSRADHRGVL